MICKEVLFKILQAEHFSDWNISRNTALFLEWILYIYGLPAVGTLIHKGYCSAHLAAEGRTTTGSRELFKFPELLGSTSYIWLEMSWNYTLFFLQIILFQKLFNLFLNIILYSYFNIIIESR
jgi:hypothetical protein